jgi:hypothetical protein
MSSPLEDVDEPEQRRWPEFRKDLSALLWASFLAACVATLFFFAFLDPLTLADDATPPVWLEDRRTGYAIGLFFFWCVCTIASALTAFLLRTRGRTDQDAP